jgi:hypothetical protein
MASSSRCSPAEASISSSLQLLYLLKWFFAICWSSAACTHFKVQYNYESCWQASQRARPLLPLLHSCTGAPPLQYALLQVENSLLDASTPILMLSGIPDVNFAEA